MDKKLLARAFSWGIALWLFGYLLSIVLFFFVPLHLIGWIIAPLGLLATLWVLIRKLRVASPRGALALGGLWLLLALLLDYLFIIRLLQPAVYYKPSVYFYYLSTFLLPLLYWLRTQRA